MKYRMVTFLMIMLNFSVSAQQKKDTLKNREIGINVDMISAIITSELNRDENVIQCPYYGITYKTGNNFFNYRIGLNYSNGYYEKNIRYVSTNPFGSEELDSIPSRPDIRPSDTSSIWLWRKGSSNNFGIRAGMEWRKPLRFFEHYYGFELSYGITFINMVNQISIMYDIDRNGDHFYPPDNILNHSASSTMSNLGIGVFYGLRFPLSNHFSITVQLGIEYVRIYGTDIIERYYYDYGFYEKDYNQGDIMFEYISDISFYYKF